MHMSFELAQAEKETFVHIWINLCRTFTNRVCFYSLTVISKLYSQFANVHTNPLTHTHSHLHPALVWNFSNKSNQKCAFECKTFRRRKRIITRSLWGIRFRVDVTLLFKLKVNERQGHLEAWCSALLTPPRCEWGNRICTSLCSVWKCGPLSSLHSLKVYKKYRRVLNMLESTACLM